MIMIDFLKTWGALIIAFVALVRPWVKTAWRHFYEKPTLFPHPAGTIEIGFSDLGPTIGVMGTLEGRKRQAFVTSMDVELIRLKDNSSHSFSWGVFRSFAFGKGDQGFELSSGFLLRPEEPHRYNIQFWERTFQKELQPKLEVLRQAWQDRVQERVGDALKSAASGSGPSQNEIRASLEELYREFSAEEVHASAYETLQRMCYWEPGSYRLELSVSTTHPEAAHSATWNFELEESQVGNLRLNIIKTLQVACSQPSGQFNFANAQYVNEDNA